MTAAVLSIGTELTRGELVNSNATWLSEQLTALGFTVLEHLTVDDDIPRIVEAVKQLASRHQVVVSTGGLGPTTDDLTTQAVADALGVGIARDPTTVDKLQKLATYFGRVLPPNNMKQADFPIGSQILLNDEGSAPGFAVEIGKAQLFFMPGVPKEMKHIFSARILPRIAELAERNSHQIHFRTFGTTESALGQALDGVEDQFPGVTIGYRASFPEVELKVLAHADSYANAAQLAERAAEDVKQRVGHVIYGDREDTYPSAIGRTLRDKRLTLSLAESCTGGMLGSMLTSVPGSSEYLLFDAVVYSNAAKTSVLGVPEDTLRAFGAVSEETAVAMVRGVLRVSEADLGVSVTGIAGPGGGTDEKPVGTVWIGVGDRSGNVYAKKFLFRGDRQRIRTMAAYTALRLVREHVNS
ncbi:MAG TPA: competence/damage-inducible protein A [Polyangiales bacterium]|nr:competence/damage-inducible protein A [Polyangiales bacterium]